MSNLTLHIDKPKLRKGLSHIMKTSWLTDGLDSIAFEGDVTLRYYNTSIFDSLAHCFLIRAHYWLPNANVDHDRFYICIGISQSHERKVLEHIVRTDVIPQLINWMVEVKNLPDNSSKKTGQCFTAEYIEGKLIIKT